MFRKELCTPHDYKDLIDVPLKSYWQCHNSLVSKGSEKSYCEEICLTLFNPPFSHALEHGTDANTWWGIKHEKPKKAVLPSGDSHDKIVRNKTQNGKNIPHSTIHWVIIWNMPIR